MDNGTFGVHYNAKEKGNSTFNSAFRIFCLKVCPGKTFVDILFLIPLDTEKIFKSFYFFNKFRNNKIRRNS